MSLNATTSSILEGIFNPHVDVHGADLYKGVDYASLNMFEKGWMNWYIWWDNPIIATGIMSFVLHELLYFGRAAPWVIIDHIPYLRKYKIQDDKAPTWKDQWECTKYVLISHFTVELPQIWGFHPMCTFLGLATHEVPFPSLWTIAWQISLFFVLEDTWHYWAHRLFHWGPFYRHIHKKHHEYAAPFGLAAEYAHPLETLTLGMGTIGGPLLTGVLFGNVHLVTVYLWIVCRLFQAIDSHSGYDFPFSLRHILPFWAGADHHDHHHQAFVGCYASSFRWWDYICDTEGTYHAARENQKEMRKLMEQGMDRAQAKKIAFKRD